MGASAETRGAAAVAGTFKGRALGAELMRVDGLAALVWAAGGQVRVVFAFVTTGDRISEIALIADPVRIAQSDIAPFVP
jgi:RNA polymerase sigma-70 factor (ECF subfamily)